MTQSVPALAPAFSTAQKCHWCRAVTLAFPTETAQPQLQPLQILSRLKGPHLIIWCGSVCSTNSFLFLAPRDHWPLNERERRQDLNCWTLSCWKGTPFSSALPSSLAGTALNLFVGYCGQAQDLSRWETPPWEVSMREAPGPWAAHKEWGW